jgi:hypothetical protein
MTESVPHEWQALCFFAFTCLSDLTSATQFLRRRSSVRCTSNGVDLSRTHHESYWLCSHGLARCSTPIRATQPSSSNPFFLPLAVVCAKSRVRTWLSSRRDRSRSRSLPRLGVVRRNVTDSALFPAARLLFLSHKHPVSQPTDLIRGFALVRMLAGVFSRLCSAGRR